MRLGARAAFAATVSAALGFLVASPVALAARPITLDDYFRVQTLSDPQFSPDGNRIAYVLTSADRKRDEFTSDLWLANWTGEAAVQLTHSEADESHPRWSPDGSKLAFLVDRSKEGDEDEAGDQIWVLDLRGGEARQLSHFESAISGFAWSPDGTRMVFTAEVPKPPKDDEDKPAPIVIDRMLFKSDTGGYLGKARTQLFLLEVASGAVTPLTQGANPSVQPAWSPDGRSIAFFSSEVEEADFSSRWDLYLIEARAGATPRQLTQTPGIHGDVDGEWGSGPPQFSPDGRKIAFAAGGKPADIWYGLLEVGVVGVDGRGETRPAAALDRNTISPRWSRDGREVFFRLEDDLHIQLARVRLSDGNVERLTPREGTVLDYSLWPRGNRAVVIHSSVTDPGELRAVEGRSMRTLTHHHDALRAEVQLQGARKMIARSHGDLDIHSLVVEPASRVAGARVPTVFRLHGGPVSQHQDEFDFAWQWFAARGYAVVAPNPRGSSGRGYAFQRKLWANWGRADVPDILAIADQAVAEGFADPARLGVGGWSYGSILTNYVIATDTRFKAATSGAGMSNMLGGYGVDQYTRGWEAELGLPWENTTLWIDLSYPFLHADRIKTPTLFLSGARDFNVPLSSTEQMYQALRRLGVPTQLVIYPDQHHAITRPTLQVDRMRRYVDWYDKYLVK